MTVVVVVVVVVVVFALFVVETGKLSEEESTR